MGKVDLEEAYVTEDWNCLQQVWPNILELEQMKCNVEYFINAHVYM